MKISNFVKSGGNPCAIAICGRVTKGWDGKRYTKLAPSWSIWKEWNDSKAFSDTNDLLYTDRYRAEILAKLDPRTTYNELCAMVDGEPILICYEHEWSFCHRHLVAEWFRDTLGIYVPEVKSNVKTYTFGDFF